MTLLNRLIPGHLVKAKQRDAVKNAAICRSRAETGLGPQVKAPVGPEGGLMDSILLPGNVILIHVFY